MRINTNLIAMNTFNQYTKNNNTISKSVEKLSSGYAINSAADNAAGLAISEKMRSQIRGLDQASTNSQDAISLVQTAEGSLSESTEILQRMRELSVQSSNDTNQNAVDREALQDEFSQLQSELNDISTNTGFNKKNLLDGSLAATTANTQNAKLANASMSVELGNVSSGSYTFNVSTELETAAVDAVKTSFTAVNGSSVITGATAIAGANTTASSLLNGNYTLSATYDSTAKAMTIKATGDNGQSFTASLTDAQLATATAVGTRSATLKFGTNDDSFNLTLNWANTAYDSTSSTSMDSLASEISKVSVVGSNGVDQKAATYGVYANMTGADSVKLAAGMDSVTFSNGAKVNFDKLTTADVDTTNLSSMTTAAKGAATAATDALTGTQIKYSNYKASGNADITAGALSIAGAAFDSDGDSTDDSVKLTATNGTQTYTAVLSADDLAALSTTAAEGKAQLDKTLTGVTFSATDGSSFTLDITNDVTKSTKADGTGDTAVTFDETTPTAFSTSGTDSAVGVVTADGHQYGTTFSTATTGDTTSTFNVVKTENAGLTFQVGANSGDELTINIDKMDSTYLGVASLNISTQDGASAAISAVDKALNTVSSQRAYLGAIENRLDHKIANLNTSSENLTSAESEIRDVDMASEMTKFTNSNILSQAATAMLAQANSLPQNVLSLLK